MEGQVKAFIDHMEMDLTYTPSTRLAYENDLRCFLSYLENLLGRSPVLSDFSASHVAEFLENEKGLGRRPSTLLRRRASIRRFADFLGQQNPELITSFRSEARLVDDTITSSAPGQKPRHLSDEQIDALWGIMEASPRPRARRDQAILALLLESGITVGTLTALNLEDVDLENDRLYILLDQGSHIWLPLGRAAEPVRRYLKEGRPELNYQAQEPALFISQTGGRMSRQGVWQVLRQWGNRAKLPLTLSPRLVRHTAAHRLARAGRALDEIQALLGHSNPLSTQALLRRLSAAS